MFWSPSSSINLRSAPPTPRCYPDSPAVPAGELKAPNYPSSLFPPQVGTPSSRPSKCPTFTGENGVEPWINRSTTLHPPRPPDLSMGVVGFLPRKKQCTVDESLLLTRPSSLSWGSKCPLHHLRLHKPQDKSRWGMGYGGLDETPCWSSNFETKGLLRPSNFGPSGITPDLHYTRVPHPRRHTRTWTHTSVTRVSTRTRVPDRKSTESQLRTTYLLT